MLKIYELTVAYSTVPVLHGIDLEVPQNKIVALLGANGAGKSTILKSISGLIKPISGRIEFCGQSIAGLRPDEIVKLGVAHVPEGRLVFPGLTVADNLKIGTYSRKYSKNKLKANMEKAYELFPRLAERRNQLAGTMSGGEQQMLAIARAIMSEPRLLMLDEPSLGLAPVIVDLIMDKIKEINEQGTTILLIEQNAELALAISDYAYVMSVGELVLSGESREVAKDKSMLDAYLGGEK
ncbi:leucine/isoleucine/valine transporter subunit; ATP-binding component of ABC superfamily [Tepidanaerobacter acetatoxydans Re1]|uniref:Leucine/isoleucine/valine transporter subunit ATP-binding component of ABC superfamily n=2 Tax=Tepidanaerobacter acetatoxydans TaxID=499229 RepID=F4LX79_TEPAE|nr:ABC transporter ATP-binding protein [Tepidanaerobacter acetatoxydans]AEE91878.1 Fe(3+)-transporting ATPase [Tepidanaerobacter acetatoxydans Re1]CCP26690.1 leucine/isoleucine/valine transporter subunit; ATP-binding component of ABC superfamily [Tepidanaerobacter acetatoxydans Re1]